MRTWHLTDSWDCQCPVIAYMRFERQRFQPRYVAAILESRRVLPQKLVEVGHSVPLVRLILTARRHLLWDVGSCTHLHTSQAPLQPRFHLIITWGGLCTTSLPNPQLVFGCNVATLLSPELLTLPDGSSMPFRYISIPSSGLDIN